MGWFVVTWPWASYADKKDFPKRLPSYNNYGRLGILVTGKTIAVSGEDGPLCKCPLLQLLFPRIL